MSWHARFGGSSADRWMRCYGSTQLIDTLPEHLLFKGNTYTEEGTVAHAVGERCLLEGLDTPEKYVGHYVSPDGEDWSTDSRPHWYEVTEEMAEAVQVYLDVVRGWVDKLTGDLHVEHRFKVNDDMGGTADAVIVDPLGDTLVVIDYKHGAGYAVDIEENYQLMFYGAGAMRDLNVQPERVILIIVQPRAVHASGKVRAWEITGERLQGHYMDMLDAADRSERAGAPLIPGPKQCQWCDALAICPAAKQNAVEVALDTFADLIENDDKLPTEHGSTLADALRQVDQIENWCRAVRATSLQALEADRQAVPGWKLVYGRRGNRRWKDEAEVLKYLKGQKGITKKDYLTEPKLRSPAQIEKLKTIDREWLGQSVVQSEGNPHVAPADDPRDEVPLPFNDLVTPDEDW